MLLPGTDSQPRVEEQLASHQETDFKVCLPKLLKEQREMYLGARAGASILCLLLLVLPAAAISVAAALDVLGPPASAASSLNRS